ncbi:MAG: epoxyqueuosine reductase QueH [Rickettsiales bacterium]|nr:epoxyqueuosine reductase QueH [Rickettsiales bacterium]
MHEKIRLVLLSCCAPCSCGAIKELVECRAQSEGFAASRQSECRRSQVEGVDNDEPPTLCDLRSTLFDFIVLFYNPNIYPDTEYQKRLAEQIRYCESLDVKYAVGDYDHAAWLNSVRGLESEPERGKRCTQCFRHRFRFAKQWAMENGYNAIASVLGVSRHKDQAQVDSAAREEIGNGEPAFAIHLRRGYGGQEATAGRQEQGIIYLPIKLDESLRQEISKKAGFYRQNYCGCEFSMRK